MDQEYQVPWGKRLRILTALSLVILLLVVILGLTTGPHNFRIWRIAIIGVPLAIIVAALPFMVRGYTLTSRSLIVHRPGYGTMLPLDDLRSVRGVADQVQGSLRLFGNGGLFSITGWFWNRRLGRYRAFATDPDRAVMLEFGRHKVLVAPHDPQAVIVLARKLLVTR